MIKFSLITLSLFIQLSVLFAENNPGEPESPTPKNLKVKGTVIDITSGEALSGVKVSIPGIGEVYTDFEGNFEFTSLESGEYSIICNMVTYQAGTIDTIQLKETDAEKQVILMLKPITEMPVIEKYNPNSTQLAQNVG